MSLKRKKSEDTVCKQYKQRKQTYYFVCIAILKSFNILFLGFSKGADPGMPELTLMK